jgi:hypothetical protein
MSIIAGQEHQEDVGEHARMGRGLIFKTGEGEDLVLAGSIPVRLR